MKNLRIKFLIILGVILACVYGIIGVPWPVAKIKENFNNNIKLGLDLKGGSQLVMQVQVQDAFRAEAGAAADRLREEMVKKNIEFVGFDIAEPKSIEEAETVAILVKGVPATKAGDFRNAALDSIGQSWDLASVNPTDYKFTMKRTDAINLRRDTIVQTASTVQRKIDGLGLAESSVQQRGNEQEAEIMVQLPGVDDPARIKDLLQRRSMLEWAELQEQTPFNSREEALGRNNGMLPLNTRLVRGSTRGGGPEVWWMVKKIPVVTGRDLRDAQPSQSDRAGWDTNFVLTQDAARRFSAFTGANIGKRAAIILDDMVISAPEIQGQISDSGRIMGAATQQEAADLALNLRAGALPASVVYLEERSVGPSLGADSIQHGFVAGAVGIGAVVLVMLVYYKKSGVNAVIALILNAIILLALLAYFGAVLTLPGIAGFILTIGMAVDSNVLIFERIREELRSGKGVIAAIQAGFGKAWWTIVDTHVTTIVSCAFLFVFGSPQIRGFAVTLVIGLVANVFTAVFVSKVIFDWEMAGKKQVESLSI
jgi:preprotein translocase subunit SecD